MKPQIEIYNMLSSIYIRQVGDEHSNSENISYLIAAQKINNDIIALSSAKEEEDLRAKILMKNGIISQSLLKYTDEIEYGYKAISAFEEIVRIFSLGQKKRETASAQLRIGETYSRMADIENTAINCKEAIKSYLKALKIYTRKEFLAEYIQTQYRLGVAYYKLSEVRNKIENLKKSIEETEKLRKIGKLLLAISGYYGYVQNLLGALYSDLAEVEENGEYYTKVFDFYQEALGQSTLQKDPLGYAVAQNNLGAYYGKMANIEKDKNLQRKNCESAIDCFNNALKVYTYEKFPQEYSETKTNICEVYRRLAEVQDKIINCKKAIENCEEALRIQQSRPKHIEYARTQFNLGLSYDTLAEVENSLDNYKEAVERYGEVLKIISFTSHPTFYAKTQKVLGNAYQNIAKIDDRKTNCEKALKAYKIALSIYRELGYEKYVTEIQEELKELSNLCNS
jgi:tetratricopeptide (TPR) repeat protein